MRFPLLSIAVFACASVHWSAPSLSDNPRNVVSKGSPERHDNVLDSFCDTGSRVMGGCTVSISEFPWQVGLIDAENTSDRKGHMCGGTVIGDRWVLTAAHCVDSLGAREDLAIYAGSASLQHGGSIVDVERVYIHADYLKSLQGPDYDIAVLELRNRVQISPVRLAARDDSVELNGNNGVVIGWGEVVAPLKPGQTAGQSSSSAAGSGAHYPTELMGASVPVVDAGHCNADRNNEVCAGFYETRADACYGDSGGPLLVHDGNEYVQIGLVSHGRACQAANDHYGVYTRVSAFRGWIEDVMAGHIEPVGPDWVPTVATATLLPDAEPAYGSISVEVGFLPDPIELDLEAGGYVEANSVAEGCAGYINDKPDYVVNYQSGDYTLYVSALSQADTTLVVISPSGAVSCNDDAVPPDILHPAVSFANPQSGAYRIWVGTYASGAFPLAVLYISEVQPFNPQK